MTAAGFSRRQVLTFAGLVLGVGIVDLGEPGSPAAAAPADPTGQQVTLEPVANQPVTVLSGDSTPPTACPRQLAVKVVNNGIALPAGAQIAVTFDPRLFAPLQPARVTLGGRAAAADSTTTTSSQTGLTTCTITLKEAVPIRTPGQDDLMVVVGTAHPLLYPRDLVRRPAEATADVAHTNQSPPAHRSLQPTRPLASAGPATPWGIELSGVWTKHTWGGGSQFRYYHPSQVTIHSVGPGAVPVPASFAISVDPRLVRDITIASVRLNHKAYDGKVRLATQTRTAAVYQTQWRSSVLLKPGDVMDVLLKVSPLSPAGALPTIKHPVVGWTATGSDVAQRQTGLNSITRQDSVWR